MVAMWTQIAVSELLQDHGWGSWVKFEGGLVWLMPFAGDGQSLLDDEDGLGSVASPSKVSWSSRRRG